MTNNNLSHLNPALDKMKGLVDALNERADTLGDIHKNMHKEVWDPFLHLWNHKDLLHMLQVLNEINKIDENLLDFGHDDTIDRVTQYVYEGIEINNKNYLLGKQQIRNWLDKEKFGERKMLYWKFGCSIREIWNNVTGEKHPLWAKNKKNKQSKQSSKTEKTTVFTSNLFTRKKI